MPPARPLRVALVGAVVVALLAPTAEAAAGPSPQEACLRRANVVTLTDAPVPFPGETYVPDGSGIDARRAAWTTSSPYPLLIRGDEERRDLCFVGGLVTNPSPHETTSWDEWHDTAGMVVQRRGFEVIGTTFDNVGDGIRFSRAGADGWSVTDVHMTRAHDDCIENDAMSSGTIEHSYFDGCYVFYSARGAPGVGIDGGDHTVTITDTLVRMEAMPHLFDSSAGPGPGHGPVFKLATDPRHGRSPRLVVRDTTIRIDQLPSHGSLDIPTYNHDDDFATPGLAYLDPADCSDNTLVWLGEGPFPGDLPPCFTVTTDPAAWHLAVADWEATPAQARAASTRVVQALVRATCGRIGT